MTWLDTLRTQHRDPDALNLAVAKTLFNAHHRSKGAPADFMELSIDQKYRWIDRAVALLAADKNPVQISSPGARQTGGSDHIVPASYSGVGA